MSISWTGIWFMEIQSGLQYKITPRFVVGGVSKEINLFLTFNKPLSEWGQEEIALKSFKVVGPLCELEIENGFQLEKQEGASKSFLLALFIQSVIKYFFNERSEESAEQVKSLIFEEPVPLSNEDFLCDIFKDSLQSPL